MLVNLCIYENKKRLEPSKKSVSVFYKHFEKIFRLLKNKNFNFVENKKYTSN